MADQIYDIAIVGLGPAGSTIARLLRVDLKIVALDKKSFEGGFRKPCGGLLAPDAQKAISKLGLTLPKEIMVDPQIFSVKTIDLRQRLLRNYQRFYINLDRHKFDLWLMSLIPKNVRLVTGAVCTSIKKSNGNYIITYKKDNELRSIMSRHVVGADGANSVVRRFLFPDVKIRRYLAIQQWYADINPKPFYSSLFDSRLTDCYGWSISKDGYFILGGAFPKENALKRFERLKKETARWGFVFKEPVKTEACMVLRPKSFCEVFTGRDGAFLAGESAGFISPSSLEGISYAFDSASELAKVLNTKKTNLNKKYNFKTLRIRLKIVLKNLKSFFIYMPFIRKIIMKTGLLSINVSD